MMSHLIPPSSRDILAACRAAGYRNPVLLLNGVFGYEVRVTEDLRTSEGWPRLWDAMRQLGIARGGGGIWYQQILPPSDAASLSTPIPY